MTPLTAAALWLVALLGLIGWLLALVMTIGYLGALDQVDELQGGA